MLLNDSPRLLEFDPKVTSTSIKNEYDFYRPFGKETPIVHGQYSNLLYLIQVKNALNDYKRKALKTGLIDMKEGQSMLDHIDYFNMHLPYSNMGKKALAYLVRHELRNTPKWKEVIAEVGMEEPVPKDPRGTIESIIADSEFMTKSATYEILYKPNLSINIIIKEYLNASNFFLNDSQTKYLNAILDNIAKKIRHSDAWIWNNQKLLFKIIIKQ